MNRWRSSFWRRGPGIFTATIMGLVFITLFAFLFGFIVQQLWNALMPSLFNLKTITYWQGFGLVILARILIGTFGSGMGKRSHYHKMKHYGPGYDEDSDNQWYVRGGWNKWKYYNKYWKEEGKEAFEKYIEKLENERQDKDTQEPGK